MLVRDVVEYDIIKIPKDYDFNWRKHANDSTDGNNAIAFKKRKLDANLRAEILGESSKANPQKAVDINNNFNEGPGLRSDFFKEESDDHLKGTKHLLVDIPFKADKNKVQRFKNFIDEIEQNIIVTDTSWNMMTGSQLRKEKQEFEQLYKLEVALRGQRDKSDKYAQEVVSSKKYREEITDEKKQELIEQIEQEK